MNIIYRRDTIRSNADTLAAFKARQEARRQRIQNPDSRRDWAAEINRLRGIDDVLRYARERDRKRGQA